MPSTPLNNYPEHKKAILLDHPYKNIQNKIMNATSKIKLRDQPSAHTKQRECLFDLNLEGCRSLKTEGSFIRSTRNSLLLAISLFITTVPGCNTKLPEVSWEGEHVRFANGHNTLPCGETLQRLDDMIGALENVLGLSLPEGLKITYYWLPGNEANERCPGSARSCSSEMVVISDQPIQPHELVHAITHLGHISHLFFDEGLAVAYGETPLQPPLTQNLSGLIRSNLLPYLSAEQVDYQAAGFFVRYLIKTYGIDKAKELFALANPGSNYQDINMFFLHVFNISLEEVLSSLNSLRLDNRTCYMPQPRCLQSTKLQFDTINWKQTIQVGCYEDFNLGPFSHYDAVGSMFTIQKGEIQIPIVFHIKKAGTYRIDTNDSSVLSGLGFVRPCFFRSTCDWNFGILDIGNSLAGENSYSAYFEQGDYQIDFHLYSEGILNIRFELL